MHIVLALAGLAVTAFVWLNRAQRDANAATDLIETAADIKNAARRFGFRRRANQHPIDGIDDPDLAIGGLATAFLELDNLPTADARTAMDISLRKHLNLDAETSAEVAVMGRWFVNECGGPEPAFPRLAKKLRSLDDGASFPKLMEILKDITAATGSTPSARQSEALADLARVFRLK